MGKSLSKDEPKVIESKNDHSATSEIPWKDVVSCEDVEILEFESNKIGKKMQIKKSGVVLHYNENLWSERFMGNHEPNIHFVGPPSKRTEIVMENDDGSIFLRYFEDDRVFMIEAAEVAVKLNNLLSNELKELIAENFEKETKRLQCSTSLTNLKIMTIDEVKSYFDSFGLDKSLVTLVPDPMFADNELQKPQVPLGLINSLIPGPYWQPVYSISSAICRIFRDIISHVDWSSKPEELVDFTEALKKEMSKLIVMSKVEQPATYLRWNVVEDAVDRLASNPIFLSRKGTDKDTDLKRVLKYKSDENFVMENMEGNIPALAALSCLVRKWINEVLAGSKLRNAVGAAVKKRFQYEFVVDEAKPDSENVSTETEDSKNDEAAFRSWKSKWKDVLFSEDVEFFEDDKLGKKMRIKKSGIVLHYNENLWQDKISELSDRTKLVMKHDDGTIFLRHFNWQVFVLEAAEVAVKVHSIVLRDENCLLRRERWLLEEYVEEIMDWMSSTSLTNLRVMSIDDFIKFFEAYGLDKKLVTLVPDPMHADDILRRSETPFGLLDLKIPGPYWQPVYSANGALFRICQDIISYVDWNDCPEELVDLKKAVHEKINALNSMSKEEEPETFLRWNVVEDAIDELARNPTFQSRKRENTEMRRLLKCKTDDDFYLEKVKVVVKVSTAVACMIKEWMPKEKPTFCDASTEFDQRDVVEPEEDLEYQIKKQFEPLKKELKDKMREFEKEKATIMDTIEELKSRNLKLKANLDEAAEKKLENEKEMTEKTKKLEETITELKKNKELLESNLLIPCQKCYRTHQHCEEAKANLKSSESKVKKLEGRLETAEKVIKEYKEKEASIRDQVEKEWKERFEAMEKKLKDEKEMKSKMQTITKENKAIKDSNEELKREKEHLKQAKDQLQENLKQKDLEIVKLREQRQLATGEARLKDQRIEDLTKTYSRLIKENQKLKKTPSSKSEDPSSSQSSSSQPESHTGGAADHLKKIFMEMVDMKNRHIQEQRGIQATEKVQKLKALSADDAGVRMQADLELKKYNLEYQKFMDSLTKNIANLQEFLMEFVELPDAPELSNEFMTAYDEAIARELLRNLGPDEISDPECVICHDNMMELEKTLKCSKCRRRYHVPCVGKWLRENTGCPVCKTNLRDLDKYPELAPYRS